MLLSGRCEVFERGNDSGFVVRDTETRLISVVGRPPGDAIAEAVTRGGYGGDVLAVSENRPHVATALPGWTAVRATLHLLGDAPRLPRVPEGSVRLLSPPVSLEAVPHGLRFELEIYGWRSPIAAALAGDHPVSFCYAASQTEGLWDVSIDTLEEYRRQGHAARCVAYMTGHMRHRNKEPVWGVEAWNLPSLGLASKLGFVPVDEIVVFHPPRAALR
jgi:GNAT superfamily N-acetyltransferase